MDGQGDGGQRGSQGSQGDGSAAGSVETEVDDLGEFVTERRFGSQVGQTAFGIGEVTAVGVEGEEQHPGQPLLHRA